MVVRRWSCVSWPGTAARSLNDLICQRSHCSIAGQRLTNKDCRTNDRRTANDVAPPTNDCFPPWILNQSAQLHQSHCPRICGWCDRNHNFRRLWLAQIVSEIGDWFYTLAIYSLLLQLTGRASSVALALVLQVLPQALIGPAAGVINDRVSRKRVMITADLGRMVVVFAMLFLRSSSAVWMVYPLLLVETLIAAFFEPARSAVIPNITPREDVLLANTLSSATWSVNLLIGASVGGVVAVLLGRDAVFVLNALSFLVVGNSDQPDEIRGAACRILSSATPA